MSVRGMENYREAAPGLQIRISPPPAPLEAVEAVIFDIDGVLVEVGRSFREVISLAVQFYFNRVLGLPGAERLILPEETGLFKLAGRFNNDWDLAKGAAAYGVMKLLAGPSLLTGMAALRSAEPALDRFLERVRERGGGLDALLALVRENLNGTDGQTFQSLYRPDLVQRIFQEHYAGPLLCRTFYGFDPQYYTGPGLVENERYLAGPGLLETLAASGIRLGVLSGRTAEEAEYVLRRMDLDRLLSPGAVVVDDGVLAPKPDPAGLVALQRRMGFARAIYVGDTPDDWTTVRAFRALGPGGPRVDGCMVETGANSEGHLTRHFVESGVDYLAREVNSLLGALAAAAKGSPAALQGRTLDL
jgi:HAD superfamily phosphatase